VSEGPTRFGFLWRGEGIQRGMGRGFSSVGTGYRDVGRGYSGVGEGIQ